MLIWRGSSRGVSLLWGDDGSSECGVRICCSGDGRRIVELSESLKIRTEAGKEFYFRIRFFFLEFLLTAIAGVLSKCRLWKQGIFRFGLAPLTLASKPTRGISFLRFIRADDHSTCTFWLRKVTKSLDHMDSAFLRWEWWMQEKCSLNFTWKTNKVQSGRAVDNLSDFHKLFNYKGPWTSCY